MHNNALVCQSWLSTDPGFPIVCVRVCVCVPALTGIDELWICWPAGYSGNSQYQKKYGMTPPFEKKN